MITLTYLLTYLHELFLGILWIQKLHDDVGEDGRSVILISLFLKSRTKFSAPTLSGCKKLFWSQGPLLPRVRGLPALKSLSDTKGSYQNDKHKSFLPIFILIVSRFCHALFHYANIQSLFPDIEKSCNDQS